MGFKTCRWNKEEETQLLEYVNDEVSWEDISREMNRSIPACKKRLKMLDKRLVQEIAEVAKVVTFEINQDVIDQALGSIKWSEELDLDLLINFYELSIDEAKERYNATFAEIAGRLEKLYEGETEYSGNLLLKASKEIKRRKGLLSTSTPTSKKEAKILKKIHKLQQKLKEVRGE
tara:strand:- start:10869 stop:11393 length:525 start_codon:yes stop_codon:yes gene_type:complete